MQTLAQFNAYAHTPVMHNALTTYLASAGRYALILWPAAAVALIAAKFAGVL